MMNHTASARLASTDASARALKTFARQCEATHAAPGNSTDLITLYGVDNCEVCDAEIQTANSINVVGTLFQAGLAGLIVNKTLPPEGGWSDEVAGVTCGCC